MPFSASPIRFAWLSIIAALATISLKMAAYFITGSVGLLSDALESLVNLAAAVLALIVLIFANRPPDAEHAYGHSKAEYFSSAVEGALIVIAALGISINAIPRLFDPQPIEQVGWGMIMSIVATIINLVVARVLFSAGRQYRSITLEADARHLMSDVWTSAGVIIAIGAVVATGWLWLDPLIGLAVAINIIWSGVTLLRRSASGLLDTMLPEEECDQIRRVLADYEQQGVQYHALRTRQAGARRFVSVHILVPGNWSVDRGHRLLEQIERDIRQTLDQTTVFTHLEPLEAPEAWQDILLDRD